MIDILNKELEKKGILGIDIIYIVLVGSRLYGTHKNNSDYDYIVVTKNNNGISINHPKVNATIYSKDSFQKSINENKMIALESLFAPKENIVIDYNFTFILNKDLLVKNSLENIKETLSRFYKNKELDYNLAIKQLFHAVRTKDFMNQILINGQIVDFSLSNDKLVEIYSNYGNLDFIISKYLKEESI